MTDKTTNDTDNNFEKFIKNVIPFIVLIGIFLIGIYYFKFNGPEFLNKPELWGSFGDYIGGILNPIISFCTLMIAYAVWKLQKEEMAATKNALEEQAKTAEQQRREQRFFDLLGLYRETVAALEFNSWGADSTGKTSFKAALDYFCHKFDQKHYLLPFFKQQTWVNLNENDLQYLHEINSNWDVINANFFPHFRVCLFILHEIKRTLNVDHFRYAELFKNQLTPSEAALLGLYICTENEGKKSVEITNEYNFLSNAKLVHPPIYGFIESHLNASIQSN